MIIIYIFHFTSQIINDVGVKQLKDEVAIQSLISHHQFIVQCHYFWQDKKKIYLCEFETMNIK